MIRFFPQNIPSKRNRTNENFIFSVMLIGTPHFPTVFHCFQRILRPSSPKKRGSSSAGGSRQMCPLEAVGSFCIVVAHFQYISFLTSTFPWCSYTGSRQKNRTTCTVWHNLKQQQCLSHFCGCTTVVCGVFCIGLHCIAQEFLSHPSLLQIRWHIMELPLVHYDAI